MQHLQKTWGRGSRAANAFGGGAVPVPTREPSRNSWRYFAKTRQLRSIYALSLNQHLKSLPHSFRVDQRLELQPRFRPPRLGLAFIVEVCKFVSLAERQQEGRLRSKAPGFEARSLSPQFERGEIDVCRQILLAGRAIENFAGAMILISKQRTAHVAIVKQVSRGMAVVNREHVTAFEAPSNFTDPVARFQPRFG